jgi:hypothetical protein
VGGFEAGFGGEGFAREGRVGEKAEVECRRPPADYCGY